MLKPSNTEAGDQFGRHVSASGGIVVVGAPGEDSAARGVDGDGSGNGAVDSGAAYVFFNDGSVWQQESYLKAMNTGAGDEFGSRVAVSGSTIAVGAPSEDGSGTGIDPPDDNGATDSGAAYVFRRAGYIAPINATPFSWVQHSYLKASNTGAGDRFGSSPPVISGGLMVVGAEGEDSNATGINGDGANNSAADSGAAYVFASETREIEVLDGATLAGNRITDGQATPVDLGGALLGDTHLRTFTILNDGLLPLTLQGIFPPTNLSITTTGGSIIPPGGSVTFDLEKSAGFLGAVSGSIVIVSDDEDEEDFEIPVVLHSLLPEITVQQPLGTELVDGNTLNFGGQPVGVTFPSRTFTVQNVSRGNSLNAIAATITGPDAAFFVLDTQGFDTSLAAGATSTFRVTLLPTTVRAYNATLRIASNDPDENPFDIPLTGEGVTPLMIAQTAYAKASDTGASDFFGSSVAVSGNTVVVGALADDGPDGTLPDSGCVYVFVRDAITAQWSEQARLRASNAGAGDLFGQFVAISGDTIVVGANREASAATGVNGNENDNSAPNSGAAYVFQRTGGVWTQQAYLKASNTEAGDGFGIAVAISGDTVVIGAREEDSAATGVNGDGSNNAASLAGAAYVFKRNGGLWSQQAYLKASNTGAGDFFGTSLAISGDTIVVGAFFEDSNAIGINGDGGNNGAVSSGAAYVFQRDGSSWTQHAYLKASNTGAGDFFGVSVSIAGDTIIVGASGEDSAVMGVNGDGGNNSAASSGAAYAFKRNAGAWSQEAYLKASNTGAGDAFGNSVGISGDLIVVGAPHEGSDANGINGDGTNNGAASSGAAYVFQRGSGAWTQQDYLKASNTGASDLFGLEIGISGNLVVSNASFEDSAATGINGDGSNNSATDSGAAYIFEVTPPEVIVHDGPDTGSPRLADNQVQAVDYGPTPLGISVTRSFTISNVRALPLTVSSITAPSGYTVVNAPLPTEPIPAQGTAVFSVRLDATAGGVSAGNVTILTDDAANPDFVFPVTGEVPVLLPPGSLDPRFGTGGAARFVFGGSVATAYEMVVQPDRKIVLGGDIGLGRHALLARLKPNGVLDLSFSENGIVVDQLQGTYISGLAIQQGKIVALSGSAVATSGFTANTIMKVQRYLDDGSADTSFGNNGVSTLAMPVGSRYGRELVVLPSDKMIVGGTLTTSTLAREPFWYQLNQIGMVDASLPMMLPGAGTQGRGMVEGLAIASNGDILALGNQITDANGSGLALWRHNPSSGSLVSRLLPKVGAAAGPVDVNDDIGTEMAVQSDGKIVFCGRRIGKNYPSEAIGEGNGFFVGRVNSDLTLDNSFGNGGLVLQDTAPNAEDQAFSVIIDSNGRIVVVGNSGDQWLVIRYLPNGALDLGFGTDGIVRLPLGAEGHAHKVLVEPDGGILVAGHAGFELVVVKLIGNAAPASAISVRNGNTATSPLITDGQTTAISYGSARIGGTTVSKSFRVENPGTGPLTINSVTVPTGFRFSSAASTPSIAAGGNGKVTVLMPTTTLGTFSGPVTIHSNDPANSTFTFPITGQVVPNNPPSFSGFLATTNQGEGVKISLSKLIAKVSDANGDPVNVTAFSPTSLNGASITFDGNESLTYDPPDAFFGADQFSVTFSDGEAEIVGIVSVSVTQDPAFNPKNAPKLETKPGGLAISFTGIPGKKYIIQRSTDLVNWSTSTRKE